MIQNVYSRRLEDMICLIVVQVQGFSIWYRYLGKVIVPYYSQVGPHPTDQIIYYCEKEKLCFLILKNKYQSYKSSYVIHNFLLLLWPFLLEFPLLLLLFLLLLFSKGKIFCFVFILCNCSSKVSITIT